MPPGPAYNWLCVLHTTAEILANVAKHNAAGSGALTRINSRRVGRGERDGRPAHVAPTLSQGMGNVSQTPSMELAVEDMPVVALTQDNLVASRDPSVEPAGKSSEPVRFVLRASS
jgi:aarF domain-containing kinase